MIKGGHPVPANPRGTNLRIAMMVAIVGAYALLFQWLGFVVATALMSLAIGRLFGGNWGKCVLGGLALGVLLFLLFDKALDVVLPVGVLGDLL